MISNILKTILTVFVLIVLFVIALKILRIAFAILLPIAIIVIAGYIVYMFVKGKR